MPRAGPKKILRYSLDFKRKAVRLTQLPGMQVQTVANALDIHPFMLSRWRREAREGVLRGVKPASSAKIPPLREIRRLQRLEREHALLKQEHELLKKAIRFCSTRRPTSSSSSTRKGAAFR